MADTVTPEDLARVEQRLHAEILDVQTLVRGWRAAAEAAVALHDQAIARELAEIRRRLDRLADEAA